MALHAAASRGAQAFAVVPVIGFVGCAATLLNVTGKPQARPRYSNSIWAGELAGSLDSCAHVRQVSLSFGCLVDWLVDGKAGWPAGRLVYRSVANSMQGRRAHGTMAAP